jgi:CubicO group peptidase (beta-lactamase class C family)
MTDWQVPGLAIAIVKDDSVVFIRGYGVREVRKDAPVDAHTVFAIGSTTKAFTAAAVAMLVDEGTVSWEDPVVKHLPWFQLPDPWVTRQVTVRDLLAHRVAGDVGRSTGRLYYWPTSLNSEEVLRRLHFLEIGSPRFRSGFVYCNECYMAAGEIVAAVSQMSWEEFVKARIFGPLQMSSAAASAYELWDAENVRPCWVCVLGTRTVGIEDARAENIVMPHVSSDGEPRPIEWMAGGAGGPAGGLSASAADLAKWMRLLLAKGVYQEERLLSETVVNDMFSAQVIRHPPAWYFPMQYRAGDVAGHFWAYGFGWLLTDYRGEKLVMHGGGVPGQASFITLMPGQHLGIAVLTNKDAALAWALPFRVLDAYLAAPEASRTNPMKSVIV